MFTNLWTTDCVCRQFGRDSDARWSCDHQQTAKNVERICEFVIISSMIGGIICSHGHVRLPAARDIIDNCSRIIGRIVAVKRSRYLWRCVVIGESQECQKVGGAIISFPTQSACEDLIPFNELPSFGKNVFMPICLRLLSLRAVLKLIYRTYCNNNYFWYIILFAPEISIITSRY